MQSTMKAVVFHSVGTPLMLEEVPVPKLADDEILVEVRACGVCGSDLHIVRGETFPGKTPIILGHEASGIISSVGKSVTEWAVGDRVVINCVTSCGNCFNCLRGRDSICQHRKLTGIHLDGAFAQFIKVKSRNLVALPPEISFEIGSLTTDAIATPYHALKARANLQASESVAIFGIGGLGFHAVKIARLLGANPIIAVDITKGALDRAVEAGADYVVNATQKDPPSAIRQLTEGSGVDVALECIGSRKTVLWSAQSVNTGGRVAVVGLSPETLELMPITEFVRGEITLLGSSAFEIKEIQSIIALIKFGRLNVESSITKVVPLNQVDNALKELQTNPGNIIRTVVTRFD